MNYVAVALIVVIIIVVIFIAWKSGGDKRTRKKYTKKIDESNGTADENAIAALEEIDNIANPTAVEDLRGAEIRHLNVLEGEGEIPGANLGDVFHGALVGYINAMAQIEEFIEGGVGEDVGVNYAIARAVHFADDGEILMRDLGMHEHLLRDEFAELRATTTEGSEVAREKRVESAKKTSKVKKEAVAKYVADSKSHTSDSQNVHDPSVRKDLIKTLNKLRKSQSGKSVNDIVTECASAADSLCGAGEISEKARKDVYTTLKKVGENDYISQYGEKEGVILKLVWDRIHIPENKKSAKDMKFNLIMELADAASAGLVCGGGRAGRMLGALASQDVDKSVGVSVREEDYKNEILGNASKILNGEVEIAKKSTDKKMRAVGKSYEDPNIEVDDAAEDEFKKIVKEKINKMIDGYADKLSPKMIALTREDCAAAIL